MSCVWMLQRGHSGDGFVCSEVGKGATSEAGKSLQSC